MHILVDFRPWASFTRLPDSVALGEDSLARLRQDKDIFCVDVEMRRRYPTIFDVVDTARRKIAKKIAASIFGLSVSSVGLAKPRNSVLYGKLRSIEKQLDPFDYGNPTQEGFLFKVAVGDWELHLIDEIDELQSHVMSALKIIPWDETSADTDVSKSAVDDFVKVNQLEETMKALSEFVILQLSQEPRNERWWPSKEEFYHYYKTLLQPDLSRLVS